MSDKETKQQGIQKGSEKKIVELKEVKPPTQGNVFEGSQKANTVSATPVSQISNPDPFAPIMAPKPVPQVSPSVAEAPRLPTASTSTPATTSPSPAKSSDAPQNKPK